LISCRQTTSGCSLATNAANCSCRARIPFTFQVAIFMAAHSMKYLRRRLRFYTVAGTPKGKDNA
jgi:hypothetical protein